MRTRDGLDVVLQRVTGVPFLDWKTSGAPRGAWGRSQPCPRPTPFVFPTAPVFTIPTPRPSGG
jgi:hypothetical protein